MTICCLLQADRLSASVRTAATRCALFAVLFAAFGVRAEPYRPERADVVLLRVKTSSATAAKLQTPDSLLAAATQEMALGRTSLDERHFGRAEALLLRALTCVSRVDDRIQLDRCDTNQSATPLLIAYADLLQHGHDFENAERVLDIVLNADALNPQARLMRASIRLARGEPRQALSDCTTLVATVDSLVATACIAQSISLTGRLAEAAELLSNTLEKYETRGERAAWALAILAELRERQGTSAEAIAAAQRAMTADPDNVALQIQAIDLLLRHGEATRAAELLARLPSAQSVVLRRALAAKALNAPQADSLREEWWALIVAEERLGATTHERDRAIGELHLMNRPTEALRFALANWRKSRDIEDARTLVLAAQAAGQPDAAAPALAVSGVVSAPERAIEIAIAVSVVIAALTNLMPRTDSFGVPTAFAFGLLHGFGFASALEGLGTTTTSFATALAGFNLGVEAGQLLVVAAAFPLICRIRTRASYAVRVVPAASLLVAVLGTVWVWERVAA